jgi:hypothetical protein
MDTEYWMMGARKKANAKGFRRRKVLAAANQGPRSLMNWDQMKANEGKKSFPATSMRIYEMAFTPKSR